MHNHGDLTGIRSDICRSEPAAVYVRGHDLCNDIMGHLSLGDFSFLQVTGRPPTAAESRLYNAILVTLVEHGLTPSVLAARLTVYGAPEAAQAAIAAGVSGLGDTLVGSTETATRMLYSAAETGTAAMPAARSIIESILADKKRIPGVGHPIHKPADPRAVRLFEIAAEEGLAGEYVRWAETIADAATEVVGKPVPLNATGAIAACVCELGIPAAAVRGLAVASRALGIVGHLLEESWQPIAPRLWQAASAAAEADMTIEGAR